MLFAEGSPSVRSSATTNRLFRGNNRASGVRGMRPAQLAVAGVACAAECSGYGRAVPWRALSSSCRIVGIAAGSRALLHTPSPDEVRRWRGRHAALHLRPGRQRRTLLLHPDRGESPSRACTRGFGRPRVLSPRTKRMVSALMAPRCFGGSPLFLSVTARIIACQRRFRLCVKEAQWEQL